MARKAVVDNITEVTVRYGVGQATSITTRNGRIEKVTTWVPGVKDSTKRSQSIPKRLR